MRSAQVLDCSTLYWHNSEAFLRIPKKLQDIDEEMIYQAPGKCLYMVARNYSPGPAWIRLSKPCLPFRGPCRGKCSELWMGKLYFTITKINRGWKKAVAAGVKRKVCDSCSLNLSLITVVKNSISKKIIIVKQLKGISRVSSLQ